MPVIPTLPLVGRVAELAVVRDCLDATAGGRGRTLLFTGESGIGKTRVAEMACEEARRRSWSFAIGRANAVETELPYALLADALLPTVNSLTGGKRALLTDSTLDDLATLFPALARLRSGQTSVRQHEGSEFRNRLFWNFAQFLKDLSREKPLLIVLEDLHWADPSSLELLHFLARQTASAPIAILCTYRGQTDTPNETLAKVERSLFALDAASKHVIEPLAFADTNDLVRRAFSVPETLSRPFTTRLYGSTRGNPFFIAEMLKTLIETGRLRYENGAWLGWDMEALELPRSVRDSVMLRVGRLSPAAKQAAEMTAILGGRARVELLESATGFSTSILLPAFAELEQANVLAEMKPSDVLSYDFTHPIIRETLLADLGGARAGMLHSRAAQALEQSYGSSAVDHAGELAYHFSRAHDGQMVEKTVHYLQAAGRRALGAYANREALKYLRAALDRVSAGVVVLPPADHARLVSMVAHAHQRLGETATAVPLWERARDLAAAQGESVIVSDIERRLGLAYHWSGRAEEALAHFDSGAQAATAAGDDARLAALDVARGQCLQELGRPDEALAQLQTALQRAEQIGSPRLLASAHRALLLMYVWIGPPATARAHGLRALALAEQMQDSVLSFWAHWAMAVLCGLTGNSAETTTHIAQCRRVAEELGSPLLRLWVAEVEIEFAFGDGRWDEGLAIGEHAISMARALRQSMLLPRLLVWTGLIHLGRANFERGKAYVDEAWDAAGAGRGAAVRPSVHVVIPAHIGRAAYQLSIGEYAAAIETADAGLALVHATGYVVWAIHRLLPIAAEASLYLHDLERAAAYGSQLRRYSEHFQHRLGLAWADTCDAITVWRSGDPVRGAQLMRSAAEALESIPFLPDATRLRRQLAGRLADSGDREGALRELRHVHDMSLRLGAELELERSRIQFKELGARPPARAVTSGAAGLTGRELEIARAISRHKSNKAISNEMKISLRTVTTHLSNIFRKLGVSSRRELGDAIRAAELAGETKPRD